MDKNASSALPSYERTLMIQNQLGMHARAATKFVQLAAHYHSDVDIEKDGQHVNGKSIMGVLMLVAAKGTRITIRTRGQDAEALILALEQLVNDKFGEE